MQFIFDAVAANCVTVGGHRHGCCVLQRCMDHASGFQKAQIINQIVANSIALVQDPYGNYVLQYIVDLQQPVFINSLIISFQGRVVMLSKQKFASNVIEKLLRGATLDMGRLMIAEMLADNEVERMCKDQFANYVIQTALDYSDPEMKLALVEAIRPLLPSLRGDQHGRRINQKITGSAGSHSGGMNTPTDSSTLSFRRNAPVRLLGAKGPLNGFPAVMGPEPYQPNGHHQASGSVHTIYSEVGGHTTQGNGNYNRDNNGTVHQPQPAYARQPMSNLNYF